MTIWEKLFGVRIEDPKPEPENSPTFEGGSEDTEPVTLVREDGYVDGTPVIIPAPTAAWPFPTARPYEGPQQTFPLTKDDLVQIAAQEELTPEQVQAQQERQQQKQAKFQAATRAAQGQLKKEHFAQLAEERRQEREELKQLVVEAPEDGIEFVHVGTTTFAWRYHSDEENSHTTHRRVIDISSAVCNPSDSYAKWHGSAMATKNMYAGRYITIRVGKDIDSIRAAIQLIGAVTIDMDWQRYNHFGEYNWAQPTSEK